jgi:hypothetical protein
MAMNAPDLTARPPRSPRTRLGGYAILPRMLDKGRATIAGQNGEFKYNCPLDQHFILFAGIDPEALKKELAAGKGDGEILDWIEANSTTKPSVHEIAVWSAYQEQRAPTDLESRHFFNDYHAKMAPHRKDVGTWFELLDVDDFVTFGGQA